MVFIIIIISDQVRQVWIQVVSLDKYLTSLRIRVYT